MTATRDRWLLSLPTLRRLLAVSLMLLAAANLSAEAPLDQAGMLLDSARRAYNEKNYPFAAARFRDYLQRFGENREAHAARYGLALALLEGPEKDYSVAAEQLNQVVKLKDLPEHAFAVYYLGLSFRGLGVKAQDQAEAKPQEAKHLENARQQFEEAARQFEAAVPAFTARIPTADPNARTVPVELEWAARARCDLAEMQLRLNRPREAQATAVPFTQDKALARSRYHGLGLYYHGFASFLLKDYLAAGRSFSLLAPFSDPVYGTHARYLLARVHHHDNERQEAMLHYEGVIADHARFKAAAAESLKHPEQFKNDPTEKLRLETIARGPTPDHVARATFFLGVMQYEDGRFADALARCNAFLKEFPTSPLAAEARLREGFCQVQLKQFNEAQKTLQLLVDKEPAVSDQAMLWLAKAQLGAADPVNVPAYAQALKTSMDTLKKAADRSNKLAAGDPGARLRRGEILAELADTQQLARQYKEATDTYNQVLNDKLLPGREEELLLSLATAHHLAADYTASDKVCARFQTLYPRSVLLPAVLFRHAENAWFSILAAEKLSKPAEREREVSRFLDETIKRYQVVVDRYPEFAHVNLARYGLALAWYRKGDIDKAREKLEAIPAAERNGELAIVPYQLADCLLRLAPARADDAVAAGRLEEALKAAIELLDGYIAANPASPQTPDAMLKLGHCQQRQAALLAQPQDKAKTLAAARATYEQLNRKFPRHELAPQAIFERARVLGQAGDINGAIKELRRFSNELKTAPIAPMALLHLATLLRGQNKVAEAAEVLGKCRDEHEKKLAADPARSGWIPLLQVHHGIALREAGKRAEARKVLNQLVEAAPDRPEAGEAALRCGQCLKDEGQQKITDAQKKLAQPNLKAEETAQAARHLEEGIKEVRDAVAYLATQADTLKQKRPESEARARMMYEAAWGLRLLADLEIAAARKKLRQELLQKHLDEMSKKLPPERPLPNLPLPEVQLSAVPVQPSETEARNQYQALIEAFPDLAINADARFELAEMLSERGEHDNAIKLLREALDKEPNQDLTDKVRLRLGACLQAKGDVKGALAQFQAVAQNPKSAQMAQATYRWGECLLQSGDAAEAVKRLARFRDEGPFQHLAGLSDRALLRLGHALDRQKQWDKSREAFETLIKRFPQSFWVAEARYGIGWAYQNLGQFDNAVNAYNQVVGLTATELGARAQMQIGLCRLTQKRYADATTALLVVPFTYDYPHLNALSLVEAARAFAENKQPDQAIKLLERVLRDHPETEQAEVARKRLEELKKGSS